MSRLEQGHRGCLWDAAAGSSGDCMAGEEERTLFRLARSVFEGDENRGMGTAYPELRQHTDAGDRLVGQERRPILADCRVGSRCSEWAASR